MTGSLWDSQVPRAHAVGASAIPGLTLPGEQIPEVDTHRIIPGSVMAGIALR